MKNFNSFFEDLNNIVSKGIFNYKKKSKRGRPVGSKNSIKKEFHPELSYLIDKKLNNRIYIDYEEIK